MRFLTLQLFFLENKILEMENTMNEKHNSSYIARLIQQKEHLWTWRWVIWKYIEERKTEQKESLWDLWDSIKRNIQVIRIQNENAENFPNLGKDTKI